MIPKLSVFVKLQGDYSHSPRISGRVIDGTRYAITRYRWQDTCFDEKLEYLV